MAIEDFTTYTETDPDSVITVDANTVSWVNLDSRDVTSMVAYDKGVNHFDGDFEHKFSCKFTNAAQFNLPVHWALTNSYNTNDDLNDMIINDEDLFIFYFYHGDENVLQFGLQIIEDGEQNADAWTSALDNVVYFIRITRDDDGGANNTGQLKAYIATGNYDDEAGSLQDTLSLDCAVGEQNDFQYIYPLLSFDTNHVDDPCDGFTENLDLGEDEGIVIFRRRRAG